MTTRLNNISIVSKNRNIEIPEAWINIQDDEEICGTYGEFEDSLNSDWDILLNCITFGGHLTNKLRNRKAFVLTTKRLVVVVIDGEDGVIPLSDRGCKVDVRSLYFGSIKSGYITSNDPVNDLETGVWTEGGFISLKFKDVVHALPFVKLLHQSVNRYHAKDSNISMKDAFEDMLARNGTSINQLSRLSQYHSRQSHPHRINNPDLLPMMDGESIVDVYNGQVFHSPFGTSTFFLNIINKVIGFINYLFERDVMPKANYVCSKRLLGTCWPALPFIVTCGSYPESSLSEVIITDNTIFHINRTAVVGGPHDPKHTCTLFPKESTVRLVWM
jgi:hypothetical protein